MTRYASRPLVPLNPHFRRRAVHEDVAAGSGQPILQNQPWDMLEMANIVGDQRGAVLARNRRNQCILLPRLGKRGTFCFSRPNASRCLLEKQNVPFFSRFSIDD